MHFGISIFPNKPSEDILKYTMVADESKFDFIWIPDECPAKGYRDPFVLLGLIAKYTRNARVGTGITNPYSRHPALIVSAFITIYEIAGGRVVIGIGAGGEWPLKPLGIPMWTKPIRVIRETIQVIRDLLGGKKVKYQGIAFNLNDVEISPVPQEKIPIYLAARGPKMLRLAGELADGVIATAPKFLIKRTVDLIKRGISKRSSNLGRLDIANALPFAIEENKEKAYEIVKARVAIRISTLPREMFSESEIKLEVIDEIKKLVNENKVHEAEKLITDYMIDNFSIAGDIDTVKQQIKAYEKAGVTQIIISDPFGRDISKSIKLFGEEIIPSFTQ